MIVDEFGRFSGETAFQMALLEIKKFPAPVLAQPAQPVTVFDDRLRALVESSVQTVYAAPGIGLAAPQVGVSSRIVVVDVDHENPGRRLFKLVNPVLLEFEGVLSWEEGCLSVADFSAEVRRAARVRVRALTPEQEEVVVEAEGLLAVALQHEIDHIEGKLFIDRISRLKRDLYRRKVAKLSRQRADHEGRRRVS
ncbi:MAG: peptide deformylase [Deltaproteobacteria bacterium]|nr:peptide deformylase [Deltaproteobacteria bacterium]